MNHQDLDESDYLADGERMRDEAINAEMAAALIHLDNASRMAGCPLAETLRDLLDAEGARLALR